MPDRRAIRPADFDGIVRSRPEHLWGADMIAAAAGVSPQTVRRRWAQDPDCPVFRRGSRLYASRAALLVWLQRS